MAARSVSSAARTETTRAQVVGVPFIIGSASGILSAVLTRPVLDAADPLVETVKREMADSSRFSRSW